MVVICYCESVILVDLYVSYHLYQMLMIYIASILQQYIHKQIDR